MKRLLSSFVLSSLVAVSVNADIQLTLIDKEGNQTSQCIKSYSFSNNLESMSLQKVNNVKDEYSTEETLTNKTWMGKPVYRKVHILGNLSNYTSTNYAWKSIPINNPDAETLVHAYFLESNSRHYELYYDHNLNYMRYHISLTNFMVAISPNRPDVIDDVTVVVEYTKRSDSNQKTSANTFKSYLHYVPSSSTTGELVNVDLKDTGVRFLTNYSYDTTTDSCTSN